MSAPQGYPAKWCVHYRNPQQSNVCGADIPFDQIRPLRFSERPCHLDDAGNSKPTAKPCEHLRLPTHDEIARFEREMDEEVEQFTMVLKLIGPWRKQHKGTDRREAVECPKCKGRLHLSINSYNSHVHGKCETDGCLEWME